MCAIFFEFLVFSNVICDLCINFTQKMLLSQKGRSLFRETSSAIFFWHCLSNYLKNNQLVCMDGFFVPVPGVPLSSSLSPSLSLARNRHVTCFFARNKKKRSPILVPSPPPLCHPVSVLRSRYLRVTGILRIARRPQL